MREYKLPQLKLGEDNWAWCLRAADSIPAEVILHKIILHLDSEEKKRGSPTWSVVGGWLGHGSGVASAITQRFRVLSKEAPCQK